MFFRMNLFCVTTFLAFLILQCAADFKNESDFKSNFTRENYCEHGMVDSIILRQIFKIQEKMRTEEPTLDPLYIPEISTTLAEDTFMAADINVTDISALHLSNFTITSIDTEVDLPLVNINITLHMEQINITGAFYLKSKDVPWIPFFGDEEEPVEARGQLYLQPTGLTATLFVTIALKDGSLVLENLDYNATASDFTIELEHSQSLGFLLDQLISGISSTLGSVIFEIGEEQLHEVLRGAVSRYVTNLLEEKGFLRNVVWDAVLHNVECNVGSWTLLVVIINILLTSLLVCIVVSRRRKGRLMYKKKKSLDNKVAMYTFPLQPFGGERESDV